MFRDPRWGRGLETPGEDPTLTSSYAVGFVQGMQGTDEHFLKVSACLKHLIAYSTESGPPTRMEFADIVTQQDMQDTFEVGFKAGVMQGKVCEYNNASSCLPRSQFASNTFVIVHISFDVQL